MQNQSNRFMWRAMTSVLIAASFLALVFTGVILFLSPPGRVANWTNWSILGIRKQDWGGLHIWFSMLFLVTTVFHLVFNWRPLVNYFKDRMTRRLGFRWEWAVALLICLGVYGGTRAKVPPFSSLLAFNEQVKESWDKSRERGPIPHAELLTVAQLATNAGVELTLATNRLLSAGLQEVTPDIVVAKLAEKNSRSGQQIYNIMLATSAVTGSGKGKSAGQGGEQDHGSGGPGKGGFGRKTLAEYCGEENVNVTEAIARLKAKGIQATAEQNLREMAVSAGYDRPYELLEIVKGQ